MNQRLLYTALMLIVTFATMNAQFLLHTKEGKKQNIEGNITFEQTQDSWSIGGVDISQIDKVTRSMSPTELKYQAYAAYYAGIKTSSSDGSANYYFCLSDVEVTHSADGQMIPSEPGMLMMFDLFEAESADPDNAIMPEGTYPVNDTQKSGTTGVQYTFARILNKVGEMEYKILEGGEVVVKHLENGGYDIQAEFITTEGEHFQVSYKGDITFQNQSQSAEDTLMRDDVIDTVFQGLTITAHGGDADYHRFTLQLYDGDCTADGMITSGVVLNIDLFSLSNSKDEIFITDGTYTASADYQEIEFFEPFTFMAGDCFTIMGYPLYVGTYVQDLRTAMDEGFLRSGYANKGTIEIKRDGEKYYLKADLTMRNGVRLTGEYPMGEVILLDARPIEPAGPWNSTLTEDKQMVFSTDTYSYAHMYEGYRDKDWNTYSDVNEFEIIVNDHITNESFQLNLLVPADQKSPEGTYTVADVENQKYEAYTFIPGYYEYSVLRGTWPYQLFETGGNYPIAEAPAIEGSIEIVKNDDGTFTISYILKDDAEPKNTITGLWTGVINDTMNTWDE